MRDIFKELGRYGQHRNAVTLVEMALRYELELVLKERFAMERHKLPWHVTKKIAPIMHVS